MTGLDYPDIAPHDAGFHGGAPTVERIRFTGSGSEYFRIWSINLLLSIVTLGIYSAWAKVRRTRYFYDNTRLAGTSFEYHGNPLSILIGRIIVAFMFIGYSLSKNISPRLGVMLFGVMMLVMPWLVWKSLQFRLHNSTYRGIRFGFTGSLPGAYAVVLGWPLLAGFSLYTLMPLAHQRFKRYQHRGSRFGTTAFSFDAAAGSFYRLYLRGLGLIVGALLLIVLLFLGTLLAVSGGKLSPAVLWQTFGQLAGHKGGQMGGFLVYAIGFLVLAIYALYFMVAPILNAMVQNLVWRHTGLGAHRFRCDLKWGRIMFITLTNILGIVLTLGLFAPFAQIRMLRYRLESIALLGAGSLDTFVAATQSEVSATGDSAADLFGFDIAL